VQKHPLTPSPFRSQAARFSGAIGGRHATYRSAAIVAVVGRRPIFAVQRHRKGLKNAPDFSTGRNPAEYRQNTGRTVADQGRNG